MPFFCWRTNLRGLAFSMLVALSSGAMATCEKPSFEKNLYTDRVTPAGIRIDWKSAGKPDGFDVRYIVRVPEGRTLKQRELEVTQAFHHLRRDELPTADLLQLIAEVRARCGPETSEPAILQMALSNPDATCRFAGAKPALQSGTLAWTPVKGADSYLVCFFKETGAVDCREETISPSRVVGQEVALLSITPRCNSISGKPFFISPVPLTKD